MNKLTEKNLNFLKSTPFMHGGIFDNKKIYENTLVAINSAKDNNIGIKLNIRCTQDEMLICYSDETLKRMHHMEDKVSNITLDDINYVSKYPILQFRDALTNINDEVPLIIEVSDDNNSKNKIYELIKNYKNVAVESDNINILKWFYKKNPNLVIGYIINQNNLHKFHLFNKYDFIDIDSKIYPDKYIRKQREELFIIGHNITSDEEYDNKLNVYDNLICDVNIEN